MAAAPGGGALARGASSGGRTVLSFDINKTVVLRDRGAPLEAMLQAVLSEQAWGRVVPAPAASGDAGGAWEPVPPLEPSPTPPSPGLVSFGAFAEGLPRATRHRLKRAFVEDHPGFLPHLERLRGALRLPDPAGAAALGLAGLEGGYHSLLPSFAALLREMHLAEARGGQGGGFALLFRSFGDDVEDVVAEYNALCEGRHPLAAAGGFPRMDGSDGCRDRRIAGEQLLSFRRPEGADGMRGVELHAGLHAQGGLVATGWGEVHAAIQARLDERPALAVRDDFPSWSACGESDRAGKPHVVAPGALSIFLDDNVEPDHAHIVDVRAPDGTPVSFEDAMGRHIVRVDPVQAILREDYFIEVLEGCRRRQPGV